MSNSVVIVGLSQLPPAERNEGKLQCDYGHVWTLNDWYAVHDWLKWPHRVFNLHADGALFTHDSDPARWPGDPLAEYNRIVASGGQIVSAFGATVPGLAEVTPLPTAELEAEFPTCALSCSISIMLCCAILEGFQRIALTGVRLAADEYHYQAAGILRAIDEARAKSISVYCPRELEWRQRPTPVVDWANIEGGLQPYYMRHAKRKGSQ